MYIDPVVQLMIMSMYSRSFAFSPRLSSNDVATQSGASPCACSREVSAKLLEYAAEDWSSLDIVEDTVRKMGNLVVQTLSRHCPGVYPSKTWEAE